MSIKKNVAYSSILTISNYLFPFLVYPYISRVLGVTNIGICNFIDSIINYFILFSMMGINTIGIREIAKCRLDKMELSGTFYSLLTLNFISTIVALIVLVFSTEFVPELQQHKQTVYIGILKLLFNCFLVEWFYKGLENFNFITKRTIIVRTIYVVLVFIFVRKSTDYNIYYFLTTFTIVINSIINIVYSRNFVTTPSLRYITLTPYLRPFFILGIYALLTSMYTSLNVAFLGFVAGEEEVGYYSTSVKLYTLLISFFTAFTGVMMPRMSSLVSEGNIKEFRKLTEKSIDVLLAFVMPIIVLTLAFTPQIIWIISGPGYENAISSMRIIVPLLLIIGYEQIIIIQILVPLKKDKAVLINSFLGATVGLALNILLVPYLQSIGSAIVWLSSEIVVLCSAQFFVKKYISLNFPFYKVFKELIVSLPILFLCFNIPEFHLNSFVMLLCGGTIILVYYIIVDLYITKNVFVRSLVFNTLSQLKTKDKNRFR